MTFLLALYFTGVLFFFIFGGVWYVEAYTPKDAKTGAQMILSAPVWPIAGTYLLFKRGIPNATRAIGKLFIDATREV